MGSHPRWSSQGGQNGCTSEMGLFKVQFFDIVDVKYI